MSKEHNHLSMKKRHQQTSYRLWLRRLLKIVGGLSISLRILYGDLDIILYIHYFISCPILSVWCVSVINYFISYNLMFARQQLALGSPKNVTLNVLNANNFFTFDYEPTDRMNQTTNSFIDDQISDQKLRPNRANLMLTLNQNKNTNVKSAQYSRKLLHNPILNKSNMNPYTRIRRVEQII